MAEESNKNAVIFVCLGNICRSPMAEAIFRTQIKEKGVKDRWKVDSAGTGDYHISCQPDVRTMKTLTRHKITDYQHSARQIRERDLQEFDFILVMDDENLEAVKGLSKGDSKAVIKLLGGFDKGASSDQVQDPYYGRGDEGFERVYQQCWQCCEGFLQWVSGGCH